MNILKFKHYIPVVLAALCLSSCVDTVLLPDDKTVDEDFWKTKSDVSSMVMGAYQSMCSSNVIKSLIVWGDFRSDELVPVTSLSTSNATVNALTQIDAVNVETTNAFAAWAPIYKVINNCNIVLDRAESVMSVDPSYTQGDYLSDRSQMLALRALCYFYLVRNFRDVPYSGHAYMKSSEQMNIPQVNPDSILNVCIADLKEAELNALDPTSYNDWRAKGLINRDAIDAILADIYLWRASVLHSASDYQECVNYCDKVIASKQANHQPQRGELTTKEYPLADGDEAYNDLFIDQNAEESIFELQFDGNSNSNLGLTEMFSTYNDKNSATTGFVRASSIFGSRGSGAAVFSQNGDYRVLEDCYNVLTDASSYDVRKMIATESWNIGNPVNVTAGQKRSGRLVSNGVSQNYIFYRLSDVMLMKAEAMTQLAADDNDIILREAFNLVQAVNSRSIYEGSLSSDSLRWASYNTKTNMETLVLNERLRELCFEGKRWYDLMRYNYRHVEGIDYSTTLYDQEQQGKNFVNNYTNMLNLVVRKYTSGAQAAAAKMRTEPYLYMPVIQSEIDVNSNLRQNPAYSSNDEYEKNY